MKAASANGGVKWGCAVLGPSLGTARDPSTHAPETIDTSGAFRARSQGGGAWSGVGVTL